MITRFSQSIWALLFPVHCAGCGTSGTALCRTCIQTLPLAPEIENTHLFAVFDYGSPLVERVIKECKYYRKSEGLRILSKAAAPFIVEFIADRLQSEKPEAIQFVPIPQHQKKTRSRGFNQNEIVASILASTLDNANIEHVLVKTRDTLPQARMKNKASRLENLKDSMRVIGDIDPQALYILVDDVTTTGATFIEAMRALRCAGAKKMLAVAVAHGYLKKI